MMQRNREPVFVQMPELMKDHFRLAAGVDEDQGGLVAADELINLRKSMARRMPGPRQVVARLQHGDVRFGAAFRDDQIGARRSTRGLRHQKAAEIVGLGDGGGESDYL